MQSKTKYRMVRENNSMKERERELMLNTEDPSTRNNNEQPKYRMVLAISAQKIDVYFAFFPLSLSHSIQ